MEAPVVLLMLRPDEKFIKFTGFSAKWLSLVGTITSFRVKIDGSSSLYDRYSLFHHILIATVIAPLYFCSRDG